MMTIAHSLVYKLAGLAVCVVVLKLLLDLSFTFNPSLEVSRRNSKPAEQANLNAIEMDSNKPFDIDENAEKNEEATEEMIEVIESLRELIKSETEDYILPSGGSINQLIPENGGTPVRSVVLTSYRSGSTFLEGIIDSHPGTYHISEPLTDFKTLQVRGEPQGTPALHVLRSLLNCRYNVLGKYLQRSKEYAFLFTHNTRVWQHCSHHQDICWLSQFLTPVCQLFPFMSMKLVRIRLRLIEELLADPSLNLRVVLLIRDPRGVMQSRSHLEWCKNHPDCGDPVRVCSDMVDDYSAALRFTKLFPGRFRVVRYEEIALHPDEALPGLFEFFGLQYHESVQDFVKTHTSRPSKDRYSTYRNSSATATEWRRTSDPGRVQELQRICRVAMDAWGYLPAHNHSHQLAFNPVLEPFEFP